jgi:3-oxoacyl-[acyl-carrier-protein] synthase II
MTSPGRKAVITGIGVLSSIGIGKENYWEALLQGKTGFSPLTLFDTSPFKVSIAGEVRDFDPIAFLGKKGLRELDRSTRLVCSAAGLAINDAGLTITDQISHSMGVSIGTTFGSLHSISQFDRVGLTEGPRFVNPSHFPNTVINSPASRVSIRFKIKGFNTTISTGFCSGLDAISYASDFIMLQRADVVLAGGVEELCEETFLGFHNLDYLSGMDGSDPICCPFDARRNGIILSEAAVVTILEDVKHAIKRGADILAVVLGYGNAFSPQRISDDPSPAKDFNRSGNGLRNAITLALKDASLSPNDIDYISAGANSTKGLDRMETQVIKELFGDHAFRVPMSSIKSMVGESFSASGALSLAGGVGAIQKGFIPPTAGYEQKDPGCDLDYVPLNAREKNIKNVLVISSDPYGNNTAMVLGKHE